MFSDTEKNCVVKCIDSNFVSSAGKEIEVFEVELARIAGHGLLWPLWNGTAALHVALHLTGVDAGSEVITQAVSFVATANAIFVLPS